MATVSRSCSWCHTMNVIPSAGEVFCPECHHRADVPRIECDCIRCVIQKHSDNMTAEDNEQLNQAMKNIGKPIRD